MGALKTIGLIILIIIAIPLGLKTIQGVLVVIGTVMKTTESYDIGYAIGQLTTSLILFLIVVFGIKKLAQKKQRQKPKTNN